MARILWHSTAPWAPSGYGMQTALFAPRVRDLGHHMAISAYWGLEGSLLGWDGMTVYPGDTKYGNRTLPAWAAREKSDLVITLMDVWVLAGEKLKGLPLASWVPVDHAPVPPRVAEFFEKSGARPIAMSRFGERMLADADLNPLYVPHGVDTNLLRPRPDERAETRAKMGVLPGQFLVGMVANNQGNGPARKSFPEVMMAFARLLRDVPDAVLFLHSEMTGMRQGVKMGRLIEQCGVPVENVRWSNPEVLELGPAVMGADEMSCMYSAFDVLVNPSYGEGFGVPIVESQACGTPVIVTDCTSMTELCGAGWLVQGDPYYDAQESFYTRPRVDSIYRCLSKAYAARNDTPIREKARRFALQYDADLVTEQYWKPALAELLAPRRVTLKDPLVTVGGADISEAA